MEALQFLKCLLRQDLIFRTDPSDTDLEVDDELIEDGNEQVAPETELPASWDELLLDEEDDEVTEG